MKTHEVVAIGLRVFAIWLFIIALQQFVVMIQVNKTFLEEVSIGYSFFQWIAIIVPILFASVIWFFPLTLARFIVPTVENKSLDRMGGNQYFVATLVILGIYILSGAVVSLVYWGHQFLMPIFLDDETLSRMNIPGRRGLFYSKLVEFGIGVWLIIGSEGILRRIKKIRGWN